jgi:hypothetical protein
MSNVFGSGSVYSQALGQLGGTYIKGTTSNTGNWGVIVPLTDVAFTVLTSQVGRDGTTRVPTWGTGQSTLNGMTAKAGCPIYGHFTTIQLAGVAEEVIAYNNQ